jgi:hypothetical protein
MEEERFEIGFGWDERDDNLEMDLSLGSWGSGKAWRWSKVTSWFQGLSLCTWNTSKNYPQIHLIQFQTSRSPTELKAIFIRFSPWNLLVILFLFNPFALNLNTRQYADVTWILMKNRYIRCEISFNDSCHQQKSQIGLQEDSPPLITDYSLCQFYFLVSLCSNFWRVEGRKKSLCESLTRKIN